MDAMPKSDAGIPRIAKMNGALVVAFAAVTSVLADYSRMDFLTCKCNTATGMQGTWCLTDYTPKSTDRIEMKIRAFDFSSGHQALFCARGASGGSSVSVFIISGTKIRYDKYSGQVYSAKTLSAEADGDVDHVITWDGKKCKGICR